MTREAAPSPSYARREGTPLKALCRQRHLQTYSSFRRAYDKAAKALGDEFVGIYSSDKTFRRWLAGWLATSLNYHAPSTASCWKRCSRTGPLGSCSGSTR